MERTKMKHTEEVKDTKTMTIRQISLALMSAMNMRADSLGITRERMIRELLEKEFAAEIAIVENNWSQVKQKFTGSLDLGSYTFYSMPDEASATALAIGMSGQVVLHVVFYKDRWYAVFDNLIHVFEPLEYPDRITATYSKGKRV
jgi:hypothetical protein